MSKNQPFRTFEYQKKLNLDRYDAFAKAKRLSGTKLSQFAVPNVRRTHSKMKESRFARDNHSSREQIRVNYDFFESFVGENSLRIMLVKWDLSRLGLSHLNRRVCSVVSCLRAEAII